ncbi:MAG TPA: GntR family transcriptional regulator [Anaerolineaceae bacterium]|jgi:GntR family transcriptional regulator
MTQQPDIQTLWQIAEIDRQAFAPVYVQLADVLRASIADGVFHPGDQLPTEAQLRERYHLSASTVRRAINALIDQGVVVAQQGRGVFVRQIALSTATFQLGELQNLFNGPQSTAVHLLQSSIVSADARVAQALGIAVGQPTVYIRRVLCMDCAPTYYHCEYLVYNAESPVIEAELGLLALQNLFTGQNQTIFKRGEISIEAKIASEEEARILEAPWPMAVVCFEHRFYGFDDRPISFGWILGRADRIRFTSHIGLGRASV